VQVGVPPGEVAPISDLPRLAPRPVLLIQGSQEAWHTQAQSQKAALGENGQFWLVEGADHGEYLHHSGEEYRDLIVDFFDQASGR
jgi:pimeloyl-ACP methyl ester carboxylesterase